VTAPHAAIPPATKDLSAVGQSWVSVGKGMDGIPNAGGHGCWLCFQKERAKGKDERQSEIQALQQYREEATDKSRSKMVSNK
jgi:hypothetical protein